MNAKRTKTTPQTGSEADRAQLRITSEEARQVADLLLEGKTFDEAVEESSKTWSGSLEEDHRRALELLQERRDALREAMSDRLPPEQLTDYLEVSKDQFLELVRPDPLNRAT